MDTHIFVLGRNPELSIEELVSVLSPLGHIVEANRSFLVFQGTIDAVSMLSRLGGTIKIGRVVQTLENWGALTPDIWLHHIRGEVTSAGGRFNFGASVYNAPQKVTQHLFVLGLELKKRLRQLSLSARLVVSKDGPLSSVIVKKNNLVGRELLVAVGTKCYLALTSAVQDFDLYSARDYGRPSRNMERGMLPPKVAQIMLNLARVSSNDRLLDPFCGGGTILQEALFAGMTEVWGSDKDSTAISESRHNFEWLTSQFGMSQPHLGVHDIYSLDTAYEKHFFDAIVSEPFLGPARILKQPSLTRVHLQKIVADCKSLYLRIFQAIKPITNGNARMVLIFPLFRLFGEEYGIVDFGAFERTGWKLVAPRSSEYLPDAQFSSRGQLVYSREDQIVAREITVWKKQE